MKAVILAGGFGSRLSEETVLRPKPMVEIGGKAPAWGNGVQRRVVNPNDEVRGNG